MSKKLMPEMFRLAKINELVARIAASSVNSTCVLGHHQPNIPAAAKKLRKF